MKTSKKSSSILSEVKNHPLDRVKVAVTDIDGILRGKVMKKSKFLSAVESGFGFCNVVFGWDINDLCYENSTYTGWHTGYPDAQAQIDLNTFRKVPWDDDVPFFLADFIETDGTPLSVCPRQLLKKIIKETQQTGFEATFGQEFEWFNFAETPHSLEEKNYQNPSPITPGMFGYSILRSSLAQEYMADLFDGTSQFEIPLEGLHTETGPGVYEAAILYSDPLEQADRAVLFKTAVKEIGYRHQILPSFMAKWNANLPGCSGHLHQSLWKDGKNVFYQDDHPHKMSPLFKSYLAGQIKCLPEILPFYAPNINSYKRLVEGLWAPTLVTWGVENRTVSLRVIPGSESSTRLETRVPGSDSNPYLAISAALASGLYGIQKGLKLKDQPVSGNGYAVTDAIRLPATLEEATDKMAKSDLAKELFGKTFIKHFVENRKWEVLQARKAVTDWEIKRYFELV
ncbi:MAG: glutamine synthetase [Bdellovibrionaceae bacterium]|nr:glutamine synthetase [Pseudobdellovibrionaceae bacterium]